MLQIKTIKNRLDNVESFDKEVNEALRDGWRLTRREVLQPAAQAIEYTYIMLYAELEKEIVTEAERCCENCKHRMQDASIEPCASCSDDCDKWEAAE
jgi:hypothetical protein